MSVDVILGLQWGDEGKGKIVDTLALHYDIIARFQGGPNAGHTLEFDGQKHVLHTIPSGIFRPRGRNLVGNGVVIDPVIFRGEVEKLLAQDIPAHERLLISRKAHLILPSHRLLDAASEKAKGKNKIGSTLKGIGPAYMDKTGRNGLRVGDLEMPDFKERYRQLRQKHEQLLSHYDFPYEEDLAKMEEEWMAAIDFLGEMTLVDSEPYVHKAQERGEKILAEGAQGSLLDIDFGSYPFVTSSTTTCAGCCTGLGLAPNTIENVYGVFKAYCTRVGSGPFPTELFDEDGKRMQAQGNEYGSTTGRPRRCGWLDLPALKYACRINGVSHLIMMKADVLSGFDEIKVCTAYRYRGTEIDYIPYSADDSDVEPLYQSLPGWQEDICTLRNFDDAPDNLKKLVEFVEDYMQLPVAVLSVGPDRSETLSLSPLHA